jgi:hypothetical protein
MNKQFLDKKKDDGGTHATCETAMDALIIIGRRFFKQIFDKMEEKIPSGKIPNTLIILTIAKLAEAYRKIFFF